jgi:hypothetical protein
MDLLNLKNNEMKQKFTRIKTGVMALFLLGSAFITKGQAVLYEENFGTPTSNTLIQNYDGWQNTSVVYVGNGTCDIRTSSASTGYGGASGGGNVMINDTVKWFQISGVNTTATQSTVKLYCGLRKTNAENGDNFMVEFSTDSVVWVRLPMADTLPTGTGTSGWHRVCFPNVPAHPHLHLRFSNLANVDYRLDDIRITDGDETVLETVETPTCTPSGGTYYEPQQVTLECGTDGATIHYTLDGSTPDEQSPICGGILNISENCTLKAYAVKENMYNSNVMTAQFVIIDTNSLVELPFDISNNSESAKVEVKTMPGFRANKLGSSYADGSVKFESKNAGSASLTAHLDSSPGVLIFDLKGVKGGSPSAYSGVTFLVSESADGQQWSTVATLNESEIGTIGYTHLGPYTLNENTRYVRWLLASASSGNTQLNNIAITLHQAGNSDSTGIQDPETPDPDPYPNPAQTYFRWQLCEEGQSISLYSLSGNLVRQWQNVSNGETMDLSGIAAGSYILHAKTPSAKITKKLIIK